MLRHARRWTRWMQSAITALLAAGLVFWAVRGATGSYGPEDLKIEVADLRSYASEGNLIAEQALSERLTRTYIEAQGSMLRDKAGEIIKSLSSAKPQAGLEEKLSQAGELAKEVNADLNTLSSSSANPQDINRVRDALGNALAQLLKLEQSLVASL